MVRVGARALGAHGEPACPPADVVAAFASGGLAAAEVTALEDHLGSCSRCAAAVAHLGKDPYSGAAAGAVLAAGAAIGRYQILSLVGRGAFGRVYAAYDPELDRRIALKLVPVRRSGDEAPRLHEARAMAGLSSPHVVAVHDAGISDGHLYIAMEYVDGTTLRAWLAERTRTPGEILGAFAQAGRGLATAHAANIIHRDFKPENVLVHDSGRVAVTDFGLALDRSADDGAQPRTLVGTPRYMAPEGLRKHAVDARSDVYALCVSLYEALYEVHPFAGASTVSALLVAIEKGPRAPRDGRIPRHVRDALLAGLAADPSLRPPTMQALLRAFEPRPRRWRAWGAAGGVAAATAVIAGVLRAHAPVMSCAQLAHDRVGEIWSVERRAALREEIEGSRSPLAHDVAERLDLVLERYARSWESAWAGACEARRDRSHVPELVTRREACLDRLRARWASLVATLAQADELAIIHASSASYALPAVDVCGPGRYLAEVTTAPSDSRSAAARAAIAKAQVLADLGHTEAGLAELAVPLALATERADRELAAEAKLVEGALRRAVDPHNAEPPLHDAAIAASQVGRLDVEAAAKVLLVQTLAHSQLRLGETARATAYADAVVTRLAEPTLLGDFTYARSLAEWSLGGAERSLPYELATLAIQSVVRGADHPRVAEALNAVAVSLVELEHVEGSLPIQERALRMREQMQGASHPEALNARGNLALAELGRIDEAVAMQEEVAAGRARLLGEDYYLLGETWMRLARLYQWELGRAAEALAAARRARAIDDKAFGVDAPEGVASLALLARVLAAQGMLDEADATSERALAIASRALPSTHLLARTALATRGDVLERRARCREAVPLLEQLERDARAMASGRGDLVFGLHALARCAVRAGDPVRAEQLLLRALEIRERARGPESPMIADALLELAALYRTQGRPAEARTAAARAIAVREHVPGSLLTRARHELARRASD